MSTARASRGRSVPGDSITGRLMGRAHTRARVGPTPAFYHKFGLPDPMSMGSGSMGSGSMGPGGMEADGPGEPGAEGPFTFLSSAAYLRSVRQARFRLLGRLSAARHIGRVGERLTAGPAFAIPELAASDLGVPSLGIPRLSAPVGSPIGRAPSITLPLDELTVLAEPLPIETPAGEAAGDPGSSPRKRRAEGKSRSRLREGRTGASRQEAPASPTLRTPRARGESLAPLAASRPLRPVARAVTRAREGELARASSSDLRALPEVQPLLDALSALTRNTRRQVAPLIQKVLSNPTPATLASTRKALQTLRTRRGMDAATTRGELGPVERVRVDWTSAEAGERLTRTDHRAQTGLRARSLGRNAGTGRSRGLSPVLASSPSWVLVEAAERVLPSQPEAAEATARPRAARVDRPGRIARGQTAAVEPRVLRTALEGRDREVVSSAQATRRDREPLAPSGTEAGPRRRAAPTARLAARAQPQASLGSARGNVELERGLTLLATPELEDLLDTSGVAGLPGAARPARAERSARAQAPVRRAAARWAVGRVQEGEAAPLSRSATGWMSRQPTQRPTRLQVEPELLAPTAAPEPASTEAAATKPTVTKPTRAPARASARTAARTARPARTTTRPTARAAARLLSAEGSSPVSHLHRTRPAPARTEAPATQAPSIRGTSPSREALAPERTRPGQTRTERAGTGPVSRRRPARTSAELGSAELGGTEESDEWLSPAVAPEPEPLDLMDRSPASSEPRSRSRLLARSETAPRTDSRGRELLSEAPVARPASARVLETAGEPTWLDPNAAEDTAAEDTVTATSEAPSARPARRPVGPERGRRPLSAEDTARPSALTQRVTARDRQGRPTDEAPTDKVAQQRVATGPTPTLLAPEPPEEAGQGANPTALGPTTRGSTALGPAGPARTRSRRPSRVTSTVRASRRGMGSHTTSHTSSLSSAPPAPRAARSAGTPAGRRLAVAVSPTSHLEEPSKGAEGGRLRQVSSGSLPSSALPTGRSSDRAEVAIRLDRLGRALLTPKVVSELRDAVLAVVSSEERQTLRQLGARTSSRWVRTRATQGLVAALRGTGEPAQQRAGLTPRSVRTFDLSQLRDLVVEAPASAAQPVRRRPTRATTTGTTTGTTATTPGARSAGPRQTVRASARLDEPPVQLDASRWAMGVPLSQRAAPVVDTILAGGPESAGAGEVAPQARAAGQRRRPLQARTGQARRGEARRPGEAAQARMDQPSGRPSSDGQGATRTAQAGRRPPQGPVLLSRGATGEEADWASSDAASSDAASSDAASSDTRSRGTSPRSRPQRTPNYARHAEPGRLGEDTRQSTSRTMAGASLLSALARSGDPEQVVQLVLERTSELSRAAQALPDEAQTLIQRIVRGAHEAAAQESGAQGASRRGGPAAQMLGQGGPVRTITRRVAAAPAAQSLRGAPSSSATVTNGVGASQAMKMAGKLMKLIHLAEAERRADAQRQMRMSEAGSTPEHTGPASPSSQVDSTAVAVLQHKVVQAVLDALKQQEMDEGLEGSDVWG
jgi:hypothetical protein